MRLSFIVLVSAVTLAVCNAVSVSGQTKLSIMAIPDAVQAAAITPKKNARFLRSHKTEEERAYPFLTTVEGATAMGQRVDDLYAQMLKKIPNGEDIAQRWKNEGLQLGEIKKLLKDVDMWYGTNERKVYKLFKHGKLVD